MSRDRSLALLVAGILTACCARAFWPNVHAEITTTALKGMMGTSQKGITDVWKPSARLAAVLKGRAFTDAAVQEIADANMAVDQFDCAGEKMPLFSLKWDTTISPTADLPAKPCGGLQGIYDAHEDATFPLDHFDSETIEQSNNQLKDARKRILDYIRKHRYTAARKMLGAALHALQDFYSHSNYVELGNTEIDTRLGKSTFTQGKPRLAKPTEQVCYNGHDLLPYCFRPWDGKGPGICTSDPALSSGFYPSDSNAVCNGGNGPCVKCAHGDYGLDPVVIATNGHLPIKGINKDSVTGAPTMQLHSFARLLAIDHTQLFVKEILDESDIPSDPELVPGLLGLLSGSTTCRCADNGLYRHLHDKDWIDINPVNYNDSGMVVKKGDVLTVKVRGRVVWGKAGAFWGDDLVVGPEGDATASPDNHKPWVPPQMPGNPIGGVIGVTFPDDSAEPHRYPSTGGIFAGLPTSAQGVILGSTSKFWVGAGGKLPPLDVGGILFLTVNDGNLGNNKGCFQAQISRGR